MLLFGRTHQSRRYQRHAGSRRERTPCFPEWAAVSVLAVDVTVALVPLIRADPMPRWSRTAGTLPAGELAA